MEAVGREIDVGYLCENFHKHRPDNARSMQNEKNLEQENAFDWRL